MKRRGVLLLALGVLASVLAVAAVLGPTRAIGRACPAMGWAYGGDVELAFSSPPGSVAACFGEGCSPAQVVLSPEGKWLVPQSPPYLDPPVSGTFIHVEATDTAGHRIAGDLPIETESTGEHPFGPECGGPFRFRPVHADFG
jgi:hypothetical protein